MFKRTIPALCFLLIACSDRGPMPRIKNTTEGDSSAGIQAYRLTVRNETLVALITTTPGTLPTKYAVNGQAMDAAAALQLLQNNHATLCHIAAQNFTLETNKQILTKLSSSAESDNGQMVWVSKMTETLNTQTSSFELICRRYDSEAKPNEVRASLTGILDTNPY